MTSHDGNRTPVGKSTDPNKRMGVFKKLDDVPPRYRFDRHAAKYEGRDVWAEFEAEQLEQYGSQRFRQNIERVGCRWKEHMNDRGRHHAIATPEDVDSFFGETIGDLKTGTKYLPYWVKLEDFYSWLLWHTDHKHRYNPVLMAAANYEHAGEIWAYKITTKREGRY